MKRGFTLVEVLAAIIILGIIILITVPIVLKVINDSKRKTVEISSYGLLREIETSCILEAVEGVLTEKEIVFVNGAITSIDTISYAGKGPDDGTISINENCKVQMAIVFGEWCVKKDYDEKGVSVTKLEGACAIIVE